MTCFEAISGSDERLKRFGDEVLRWNAQFSLISRIDPARRLEELLQESRHAFPVLSDFLGRVLFSDGSSDPFSPFLNYLDLGSGGGFPGIPWSLFFGELIAEDRWSGLLVEPRRKRAWFLERCLRILDLGGVDVAEGRWGDVLGDMAEPDFDSPRAWLISLKALRLSDEEILRGWRRYSGLEHPAPGGFVIICRLHSDADIRSEAGAAGVLDLGLPGIAELPFESPRSQPWAHQAFVNLPDGRVSLLFSVYPG